MDDFTRQVFLGEIRHQCEFAIAAYDAVQQRNDTGTIFYHIQSFLASAANVSKVLFPGSIYGSPEFKESCRQRADELRNLLDVDENSALKDRELRDHFEHFDERIQKWANRAGPKNYIDNNVIIGMTLEQAIRGASSQDIFRTYVSPPPTVLFWDGTYELQPVVEALRKLVSKIPER